jgi:protocatechuate 3,4-dioxygenase beta subunit
MVAELAIIKGMNKRSPTPATTEGPYYKRGSPGRTHLREKGVYGDELTLSGHVFDTDGKPLTGAWLDFWQADGGGKYDNAEYALRGHQFTGESGRYVLETVIPGAYPGRTPHIHVKVSSADRASTLTTQLFFPGLASNQGDSIFRDDLVIKLSNADRTAGTYDLVLDTG